jgi:hypothetical protein
VKKDDVSEMGQISHRQRVMCVLSIMLKQVPTYL